jgi:hypothetical protein
VSSWIQVNSHLPGSLVLTLHRKKYIFFVPAYGKKKMPHHIFANTSFNFKTMLMLSHPLFIRCIILGFMVLVGFSIAKSIQVGSPLGLILSLVSLFSGIYFVYLLKQAKEQEETF